MSEVRAFSDQLSERPEEGSMPYEGAFFTLKQQFGELAAYDPTLLEAYADAVIHDLYDLVIQQGALPAHAATVTEQPFRWDVTHHIYRYNSGEAVKTTDVQPYVHASGRQTIPSQNPSESPYLDHELTLGFVAADGPIGRDAGVPHYQVLRFRIDTTDQRVLLQYYRPDYHFPSANLVTSIPTDVVNDIINAVRNDAEAMHPAQQAIRLVS